MNGVQPTSHQNGVAANGESSDFDDIMKLNKNSGSGQQQPILPYEGGEPFLMKTGPMKSQHVAGTDPQNTV